MKVAMKRILKVYFGICILLSHNYGLAQNSIASTKTINQSGQVEVSFESKVNFYYLLQSSFQNHKYFASIAIGNGGQIKLTESAKALHLEDYNVMEYPVSAPGDADSDGVDDLSELSTYSLFNAGKNINFNLGTLSITDYSSYRKLSFKGEKSGPDAHLSKLEYVKFTLLGKDIESSEIYFINTVNYNSHEKFRIAGQINSYGTIGVVKPEMRGELIYHPNLKSPNGQLGLFRFQFQPTDDFSFERVALVYEVLSRNLPFLKNNLAYYPAGDVAVKHWEADKFKYESSRIPVISDSTINGELTYLAYNIGESYGFLKYYDETKAINQSDILILRSVPNEISRSSGFISMSPQTPLSHVNLMALQDGVPNAFLKNALENKAISPFLNSYVHLEVNHQAIKISPSSKEEVLAWQKTIKPINNVKVESDLSEKRILSLKLIGFHDWPKFGVKCTNLATMKTFGFNPERIPDGYGIPFYYYDEFIKFNGLDTHIQSLLSDSMFKSNLNYRERSLIELRERIEKGKMPSWMINELNLLQSRFPDGSSIRCRSSTNNEDLPFFSGAGLYTSKTHKPSEGDISKTIKEVFAGLWNLRAYESREFYNIDHLSIYMGVLCIPNQKDEKVNGVAVSCDPFYYHTDVHYLNNQLGEDLVTNPDSLSIPEELLIEIHPSTADTYEVISKSNKSPNEILLKSHQIKELSYHLNIIHNNFRDLYGVAEDEPFAMEVEYKITKNNQLLIKQARPWLGTISNGNNLNYDAFMTANKSSKNLEVLTVLYPNPVLDELTLHYAVPEKADVEVSIINSLGQQIESFQIGQKSFGTYDFKIASAQMCLPTGTYVLKMVQKGLYNNYLSTTHFLKK